MDESAEFGKEVWGTLTRRIRNINFFNWHHGNPKPIEEVWVNDQEYCALCDYLRTTLIQGPYPMNDGIGAYYTDFKYPFRTEIHGVRVWCPKVKELARE